MEKLKLKFKVKHDNIEGGYTASCRIYIVNSPYDGIHTQGGSLSELRDNILDAVGCHFNSLKNVKIKMIYKIL